MKIRPYREAEAGLLWKLLFDTVHRINRKDYSERQLQAWAPLTVDMARWRERLERTSPIVAEMDGEAVGFAELETDGHIDCFYVHADWQGKGVGSALLERIEQLAFERNLHCLYTESSITARPFFLSRGFTEEHQQLVSLRGAELINYRMSKSLESRQP
ncbi:MAG: GNAT family N-acetyltransferase [Sedimenticola sp.]